MMTSKFLGYFLEEVTEWQKKLSTADSVITIWFEVQLTWSHLESIFIGSEDIRAQLPEHSKQFDSIDADFKVQTHIHIHVYVYNLFCALNVPCDMYIYMAPSLHRESTDSQICIHTCTYVHRCSNILMILHKCNNEAYLCTIVEP